MVIRKSGSNMARCNSGSGRKEMYIIVEGDSPDRSAVFQVLEKEPDIDGEGWYKVGRLSDGKNFRLAPDHRIVPEIFPGFLGSKAVIYRFLNLAPDQR